MAGHIVVDVGSFNPEPLRSAGAVHSRTHRTRSSPPKSWFPKGTHGARRQLVRSRCSPQAARRASVSLYSAAESAPADLREGHPAIRGGVRGASRLPAGHGVQMVAAHSLLASGSPGCRVEQYDDANDSNRDPVQPPPDPGARGGHIALVLWPPGEPPVLRSAEGR